MSRGERFSWWAAWTLVIASVVLLTLGIIHRHDTEGGLGSLAFWLFYGSFSAAMLGFGAAAGAHTYD